MLSAIRPEALTAGQKDSPDQFWRKNIDPLFDKKCLKCHAGVKQYGGLDLRSLETMLKGGEHGPAIIPGKPGVSRVLHYVQPGSDPHMPPDPKRQLTPDEISILTKWVEMLPVSKSTLADGKSKDISWVPEYLSEYKKNLQSPSLPPTRVTGSSAIDWLLEKDWKWDGIKPAKLCDDSTFVRRIYLDLAGRIPTTAERSAFLSDRSKDKRTRLVDALLAGADYPRHMREVFDTVLMGRPNNRTIRERENKGWNAYLEDSFRVNKPWNQIVREILVAKQQDGVGNGALWFLAEKRDNHQIIAEQVAPIVFGMQIKCAQCHNHPLVWEIEQRHYWGLVAAFNRSKTIETEKGTAVAESAVGGFIKFANLKKESQPASLVFLNGKSVEEKIPGPDDKEIDSADLYSQPPVASGQPAKLAPVPKFSRRAALAELTTKDNPMLAKAFVNRVWNMLIGRGIVMPVDQIDSRHPASHPDLLAWLSRDLEANQYDIKKLIRTIVLSQAYHLDSKVNSKSIPLSDTFARAVDKPLSGEQLFHSIVVATNSTLPETETHKLDRIFVGAFPDLMPDTYTPSLQQALFLSNSPVLDQLLKSAPGNTTESLMKLRSDAEKVDAAFLAVLGRAPDTDEKKQCQEILAVQPGEKGIRNLLWALITSADFKVGH